MSMSPADQAKYKQLYVQTAYEYVEKLSKSLSLLIQGQHTDGTIQDSIIAAHSLSGQSVVIGYNQIGTYTSLIQKVFEVEENKFASDTSILEEIAKGTKKIMLSIEEIENNNKELDLSEEIKLLEEKLNNNVIPSGAEESSHQT